MDYLFLTALWHGATLNFIIWGFVHGFFLTFEKIIGYKRYFSNRYITFLLISFSWVPFFSNSFEDTLNIISSIFVLNIYEDNFLPVVVPYLNFKFFIVLIFCILSLVTSLNLIQLKKKYLSQLCSINNCHIYCSFLFYRSIYLL